jgi:hypothetical protein
MRRDDRIAGRTDRRGRALKAPDCQPDGAADLA